MHYQYPDVRMFIGSEWCDAVSRETLDIHDPATGEKIGTVPRATRQDLDRALRAAEDGFKVWRNVSAYDRANAMRRASDLLRERRDSIAWLMTREQGKPIAQSLAEISGAADTIDWFAEEARRTYGQTIPARSPNISQTTVKLPVGPVVVFTPWNFPVSQIVRKLSAAVAAGCSIIIKAPEETPASPAELVRAFVDAGVPAGVVNLVFGVPAEISEYLIPHPIIQKISFTGSTPVGKQLAALAGLHMKRVTMELGGHSPVLVFNDADIQNAVAVTAAAKFRNAGQVCVAPTRFMLQGKIADDFTSRFVDATNDLRVGNGLEPETQMGPMANERRVPALEALLSDAVARGGRILAGGRRIGNGGSFFEPTVIADVPIDARIMNEEPFGPIAILNRFDAFEDAVAEANRLPYGLAAYAFTSSAAVIHQLGQAVDAGMLTVNHNGLAIPEVPFGGVKDSGYGTEGGSEAIEAYLVTKYLTAYNA